MLKFNMNFKILFLVWIFFYSIPSFSLEINKESNNIELFSFSQYYCDKTNHASLQEIKQKSFIPNRHKIRSFGFNPHQTIWIKFTLKNRTPYPLTKILEYTNPLTETVIFFDGEKKIIDGAWHISKSRESINPIFKITLKPYEERTYYIKAHSTISTVIIQLKLWKPKAFTHQATRHLILIVIFFSIMGTLLVYNLFIYIFTHDRAYLYYILYLIAIILNESTYSGVAQYYLLSQYWSQTVTEYIMLLVAFMIVSIVLFTREFLHTTQFPKIDKLLKSTLYGVPILSLLSCNNFLFNSNIIIIFLPIGLLVMWVGFYALHQGVKEARFYVFGWSLVAIALIMTNLQTLGIIHINYIVKYINDFAFIAEAILFSIALAHRIKITNDKIIQLQKSEQKRLEMLVRQKTHELEVALNKEELLYRELNHRVKNNFQMILSLIKLQSLKVTNPKLKKALLTIENRIYSIADLYTLLQLNTKELDTYSYFKAIVERIQQGFNKEVEVSYNISYSLPLNQLVYCGLILNELVTNSFKYAFKERGGKLTITLKYIDNTVYFIIEDNGETPILPSTSTTTLGLLIVQTLVTEHLDGTFQSTYNHGLRSTIEWKI